MPENKLITMRFKGTSGGYTTRLTNAAKAIGQIAVCILARDTLGALREVEHAKKHLGVVEKWLIAKLRAESD